MTGNVETFRQGATSYRNGMDWAKEQRDNAIRLANERVRVDKCHPETLAVESSFIHASSFISDTTSDATSTIGAPSEESRISLARDSNITNQLQTPEISSGETAENNNAPVKRSIEHSKGFQQKRRNAGNSDYELSHQSELHGSRSSGHILPH